MRNDGSTTYVELHRQMIMLYVNISYVSIFRVVNEASQSQRIHVEKIPCQHFMV